MPTINISEADFALVAGAANDAKDAGNMDTANGLDKTGKTYRAP